MILAIFLIVIQFIITPKPVLAIDSPTQTSPGNNAIVYSSKLTWDTPSYTLYSNNPFRIQVDDNSDFSSIYRDYTTKNTYYIPVLFNGTWYWRIKAKDSSGTWSDWSNTWSFILSSTSPSPSPTPTATPTQTPQSSPSSNPSSSFTISNIPSQINSDQSFNVLINLSLPDKPKTKFYIKGAFRKSDSTNYFGLTKVSDNWVKNGSSYSSQYPVTTDLSGNWSGNLEVKPDTEDSGFIGTDDYNFKVGRYDSTDSNPSVSWTNNESIVKIISKEINQAEILTTPSSATTNPPASSAKTNPSPKPKSYDTLVYHSASVAGVNKFASESATPSSNIKVASKKQNNPIIILGIIFIVAGIGTVIYLVFKNKYKYNL